MPKVTMQQLQTGLANYCDMQIMPKVTGWQKVALGTTLSVSIKNLDSITEKLPFIKTIGMIGEDGLIDLDAILPEVKKYLSEGMKISVLGMNMKFSSGDADLLADYIRKQV